MSRQDFALAALVVAAAVAIAWGLRETAPGAGVPGSTPVFERAWTELESGTWVRDGRDDAPRVVYAFMDPNCPYCHRFWSDARPWVEAGRVQIRHVVVGILGPTSAPKAATILAAPDPAQAFAQHQRAGGRGAQPAAAIDPAVARKLESNAALMRELGLRGTPAIVYRDKEGKARAVEGAPEGSALKSILGPGP